MADAPLYTPPYGYFAPSVSLFSNPLGSAPIIGPRKRLVALNGLPIAPSQSLSITSNANLDPEFPKTGRGYLIEWAIAVIRAGVGAGVPQFSLLAARLSLVCGTFEVPLAFPITTTLNLIDTGPTAILQADPPVLFLSDDLVQWAAQSSGYGILAPGGIYFTFTAIVLGASTGMAAGQVVSIQALALARIIDGIYG